MSAKKLIETLISLKKSSIKKMSANRGYGASCEDKKGKIVAFKDDKNEELQNIRDKKEAGDGLDYASMEGNALSSDPTESNTYRGTFKIR